MSSLSIKSNSWLYTYVIALWIFTTLWPILGNAAYFIMTIVVIIVGFLYYPQIKKKQAFSYMFIFLVICMLYSIVGKGYPFLTVVLFSLSYMGSIIASFAISNLTSKQVKFLFVLLLSLLLFTLLSTFFILQEYPNAVRDIGYGANSELGVSQEMSMSYARRGMFSYGVGEAFAIIIPALLVLAVDAKRKIRFYLLFFVVGLGLITQIVGTLTTSLIISVISCVLVLFTCLFWSEKKRRMRVFIIIFLLSVVSMYCIIPIIMENGSMMMKLLDIEDYASGGSSEQTGFRAELMTQSITVFLKNPIFGSGNLPKYFGDTATGNTVSLHSAFFDYLGLYGLFAVFFFSSWIKTVKFTFHKVNTKYRKEFIWCLMSAVLLCILKGPVTLTTSFQFSTVFVGILFMMVYYNEENVNNEKNCNLG